MLHRRFIRRYRVALALHALLVVLLMSAAEKLEAPATLSPVEESDNPAEQIARVLNQEIQYALTPLEMPIFDRAHSVLASYRGIASRNAARLFPDLIARHVIQLHADEDEIRNVRLAANAVDGIVLRPYETFSFNEMVGHRTQWKGYRPGPMFSNGQVVSGIGGGICIVSTALYNAALCSGLKIIERSPHSGCVRYAEPGLDSAIAFGSVDLKFKNDTDQQILIQTIIDGSLLKVKFFGRRQPGREIEIVNQGYREIPFKVFEKPDETVPEGEVRVKIEPRTGYEVTTVRLFKKNGKVVRREVVAHSVVPPRHKVVLLPESVDSTPESQPTQTLLISSEPVSSPPAFPTSDTEPQAAGDEETEFPSQDR